MGNRTQRCFWGARLEEGVCWGQGLHCIFLRSFHIVSFVNYVRIIVWDNKTTLKTRASNKVSNYNLLSLPFQKNIFNAKVVGRTEIKLLPSKACLFIYLFSYLYHENFLMVWWSSGISIITKENGRWDGRGHCRVRLSGMVLRAFLFSCVLPGMQMWWLKHQQPRKDYEENLGWKPKEVEQQDRKSPEAWGGRSSCDSHGAAPAPGTRRKLCSVLLKLSSFPVSFIISQAQFFVQMALRTSSFCSYLVAF